MVIWSSKGAGVGRRLEERQDRVLTRSFNVVERKYPSHVCNCFVVDPILDPFMYTPRRIVRQVFGKREWKRMRF